MSAVVSSAKLTTGDGNLPRDAATCQTSSNLALHVCACFDISSTCVRRSSWTTVLTFDCAESVRLANGCLNNPCQHTGDREGSQVSLEVP